VLEWCNFFVLSLSGLWFKECLDCLLHSNFLHDISILLWIWFNHDLWQLKLTMCLIGLLHL